MLPWMYRLNRVCVVPYEHIYRRYKYYQNKQCEKVLQQTTFFSSVCECECAGAVVRMWMCVTINMNMQRLYI